MKIFTPNILGFCCNWCSYAAADLAGVSRFQYPPNLRIIRVMCSGRVDPEFVFTAFLEGADGVMVLGCHLGECHYVSGNYEAVNSMGVIKKLLEHIGIDPRRVVLDWASAAQGVQFAEIVTNFTKLIKELGPLGSIEGIDADQLRLELQAAKMTTEDKKFRGVVGKQTEFTTKGNIYGEVFTNHEFNRLLDGIIAEEVPLSKIRLLLQEKPASVKELASRIKCNPPRVLRCISALQRKGLVCLDRIEGSSPIYSLQAEKGK